MALYTVTVVYFAKFIPFSTVNFSKKPIFTLVINVSSIRNENQYLDFRRIKLTVR